MKRKILQKAAAAVLFAAAVMAPQLAAASDREDVMEMAATLREIGYNDEALQMEQLAASLSDSELELIGDLGFASLTSKLKDYIRLKNEFDAAEVAMDPSPSSATASAPPVGQALLEDFDFSNFPQPNYPPQSSTCVNPVGTTTSAAVKVGLKATFFALREAFTAADGLQRAAIHGCNVIVIAIGVGGNAASACIISGVALGVIDGLLSAGETVVDTVIFCDQQVHFAESEASENRGVYLTHQLEKHDLELEEQLATHDVEVQAKLVEAIARATSIEGKIDLGLKTQIEVAMDRRTVRRPSIFYEDRLDELCDRAQEAINDLPPMYVLATTAQTLVNDGKAFKITDPKRAADECIRGYSMATTGSSILQ